MVESHEKSLIGNWANRVYFFMKLVLFSLLNLIDDKMRLLLDF